MTFPVLAAITFACGFAFDVLNVRFIQASTAKRALAAATYSAAVGAAGLTGFMEAVEDYRTIPFLLLGYFIGTFIAVKWAR